MAERDFAGAIDLLEQVIERVPGWPPAWYDLGRAKLGLAETEEGADDLRSEAARAFRHALTLDPTDPLGAGIELALVEKRHPPHAASHAFVAALFDAYAPRFDAHLTGTLGYTAPAQLRAAVDDVCASLSRRAEFSHVVDLGCGTGLAAEAFKDAGKRFTGVDLSNAMIAEARRKAIYADLVVGSLLDWLVVQPAASADLVIAADVFAYLGDLGPVLRASASILSAGGLACFTLQHSAIGTYVLGSDRRFAHAPDYVAGCVTGAGLSVMRMNACSTRTDRCAPVPGLLVVARKS